MSGNIPQVDLAAQHEARREAAARHDAMIAGPPGVVGPVVDPGNVPVWHLYAVQVEDRDRVLGQLHAAGIGAGIHYPTPVHLTGAFADLGKARDFPVAEALCERILSLPLYPGITAGQQGRVVDVLARATAA